MTDPSVLAGEQMRLAIQLRQALDEQQRLRIDASSDGFALHAARLEVARLIREHKAALDAVHAATDQALAGQQPAYEEPTLSDEWGR